jgi:tripartite-type tricarboxylate transporter receptor subunit TctC
MIAGSTSFVCGVAASLTLFASGLAIADTYPSRPIRLVVPAAAGGSTDIGARAVAARMTLELGQPVIVDNKSGGGGRIGAMEVVRASADGYTLLYGNSITQALLSATSKSLAYDPVKDFAPVGQTFWYSTLIVCNPSVPFNDLGGLISYGKQNPLKLSHANAGPGSGNHFSAELLGSMAGIKILNVPYKGNAPAVQDVLGGMVACTHITEAKSFLDSGKLKAIATTGLVRDPRFPNVPTVNESGLKGYDITWWQGVFAPAQTPSFVMRKLTQAVKAAAEDAAVKKQTFDSGLIQQYLSPTDVAQRTKADITKFRTIAADAKIELD